MKHWSAAYVGWPFAWKGRGPEGCDCWGVVVAVFGDRGVTLPGYASDYGAIGDVAAITERFTAAAAWPWHPVAFGVERDMDIVIFRRGGQDDHIGIVTSPGEMLHVRAPGRGEAVSYSRLERFDRGPWRQKLSGIYRHAAMMERAAA